jgi:hypothetical protein
MNNGWKSSARNQPHEQLIGAASGALAAGSATRSPIGREHKMNMASFLSASHCCPVKTRTDSIGC